jgi:sugar lactone lactonase YvrE
MSMTANNIYTIAGGGDQGDGGPATSGQIDLAFAVAVDSGGNVYIADIYNSRIRMVPATNGTYFGMSMTANNIYTIAGGGDQGDGGPATSAQLNLPQGVTVDSDGNVYISDTNNNRIRKIDSAGIITTVAGNGSVGFNGNNIFATSAQLNLPYGLSVDSAGNIYIADSGNNRIRKVTIFN